jgi:hypothetical protein
MAIAECRTTAGHSFGHTIKLALLTRPDRNWARSSASSGLRESAIRHLGLQVWASLRIDSNWAKHQRQVLVCGFAFLVHFIDCYR